jgi:hypothetical protein
VKAWNLDAGVEIDADTTVPRWDGRRMDYAGAVEALLSFAEGG